MASNKYLKRRFTLRETILLVVLLVVLLVGLYFGLVFYPIQSRTAEINESLAETEMKLDIQNGRKEVYDDMRQTLQDIEQSGDKTVMPQYGNDAQYEVLTAIFNTIFADMKAGIRSSISEPEDGVRTRTVNFSFTVTEQDIADSPSVYERTKALISELLTTGYRCSMSTLTLAGGSDNLPESTSITVTAVINFYELDS